MGAAAARAARVTAKQKAKRILCTSSPEGKISIA
jgi:hypothetical protein